MIYLFNIKDELIHILNENDLIEFYHKKKINSFDESSFDIPLSATYKEIISKAAYFGFHDNADFKIMKVLDVTYDDIISVHGLDRAESDLRTVRIIKDKRLIAVDARSALGALVENTFFSVGSVDGITRTATLNYYYISPLEALTKLVGAFNCEFVIRYNFVENRISSRYIDLYNRQGKYSGKQFYHGSDLLKVKMKQDNDSVITALIGRGKGEEVGDGYGRRIEFTDVVWGSDKPLVKPAGQNYIAVDPGANGVMVNGKLAHRWGVYVNDKIEDANELLEDTYQQLIKLAKPLTVYEADVIDIGDDISLGDSVAIIRDDVNITFQARIFEINIDKLNNDRSTVKLGDYELLSFNPTLDKVQGMIDDLNMDGRDAMLEAFNEKLEEQKRIFDEEQAERIRLFNLEMDNKFIEAENKVTDQNEALREQLQSKIEAEATKNQELIDEFKQSFDATKHDLINKISEGSPDVSALRNEFNSAISETRGRLLDVENISRNVSNYMDNESGRQSNILSLAEIQTNQLISRKFTELRVGGRNYIRDYGSFARSVTPAMSDNWKYELISDNQAKSGKCVKLTALRNNEGPWFGGFEFLKNPEFQNKQMTWSMDIKCNKTFTTDRIGFETGGLATKTITNEFQRISHTFTNKFTRWWSFVIYGHNFSQGDVIYIRDPQLEDGNVATSPRPAPEDNELIVDTKISEYRQTVDGQIADVRGIADNGVRLASNFRQEIDNINLNVSSLSSDTVKYADIDVSDNGLRFGSRVEIDGNTLGSIISLSPDGIRAVADKMIVTANNGNLVSLDKRKLVISNSRDVIVSQWFSGGLRDGDEFLVQCQCLKKVAGAKQSFNILLYVDFQDGTARKFPMKQLQGELFDTMFSLGGGGVNSIPFIVNMTFKPTWDDSFNLKPVERWCIVLRQETQSNFCEWEVRNLAVYKKKSAELIVDGSITAKHLDTNSVRTGILTANSITSTMLSSDVILAKHLKVDNAMIDKLLLNDLLVNKIIAKEALVNKIKATTIDASKITSGYITGDRIRGGIISGTIIEGVTIQGNSKIKIGKHGFLQPITDGLHINAPEFENANYGISVKIHGNPNNQIYGDLKHKPFGLYIYRSKDFVRDIKDTTKNSYILHVGEYIKAKGVNFLRIDEGMIYTGGTHKHAAKLGFWDSNTITQLYFEERDIFYSTYSGGTQIPFWAVFQSNASDINLKKNIVETNQRALDLVDKLKFYSYDWVDERKTHTKIGLIAQDVQKLDENLVINHSGELHLESLKLLNISLKAIQELSEKINRLEKKLYAS